MSAKSKIGTQLGNHPNRGASKLITEYLNKNREQCPSPNDEIIKVLLNMDGVEYAEKQIFDGLNNCYHQGYILRDKRLGRTFSFIPCGSSEQLKEIVDKFNHLQDQPEERKKLIKSLFELQLKLQNNLNTTNDLDISTQDINTNRTERKESKDPKSLINQMREEYRVKIQEIDHKIQEIDHEFEKIKHQKLELDNRKQELQILLQNLDSIKAAI